ncbi:hypothetical protein [Mesorhizobium caraganae]|uniref:hypothetical protein n=1 Tax=Mesorhizobium caraganae TaxID=483206 RepID=UPI003ED0A8E3
MSVQSTISVKSPEEIKNGLFPDGTKTPPTFPVAWQANVLLTPPGGTTIGGNSVDSLIAGRLTYDGSDTPTLRAQLYSLDGLEYFDFLFSSDGGKHLFWRLSSNPARPDDPPTAKGGATEVDAAVPTVASFSADFAHQGTWMVLEKKSHAFSGRRTAGPYTWVWQEAETGAFRRMMNVATSNDFGWAILGSFYFVDFTTFEALPRTKLPDLVMSLPKDTDGTRVPLKTYYDIASAMAEGGVQCDFTNAAALINGLVPVDTELTAPSWTDSVKSECFMIGQDNYPYYCQIWYDWSAGNQITVFVQKDVQGNYSTRFDEFLPRGKVGPAVVYEWAANSWVASCSSKGGGFVPMPVPDFVSAGGGRCRAKFEGSSYFGDLSIWTVALGDQSRWSDFWYWFDNRNRGVIFSLDPASSLTLIDYQTFLQNEPIDSAIFKDPTGSIPACSQENLVLLELRPAFRPLMDGV